MVPLRRLSAALWRAAMGVPVRLVAAADDNRPPAHRRAWRHRLPMTFEDPVRDVHVWCTFCDEIRDEPLLEDYERLLSADERQRRSRFVFPRDRHRFLVTRALVRTVLSRYSDIAPADWTFVVNAYGRPEIAPPHPRAGTLSFNVSHTPGLVVLGVGFGRALGVDTENVRARQAPLEVADRFFAPTEVAALRALPEARQPRRFVEYWTLKEAYLKARSMGLSLPLHEFAVRFIGDRGVALSVDGEGADAVSPWQLWQFSIAGDYLVAVCAGRTEPGQARLVLRRVVPLRAEEDLDARELRTSLPL
jgi:4'-phosphopantetheinyl transferase